MGWNKYICKRSIVLFLFSSILPLSGCGQSDNQLAVTQDNYVNEGTESNLVKAEDKEESGKVDEKGKASGDLDTFNRIPVNTQSVEVSYLSEDDIEPLRAMHRSISDGEQVFLAYGETDVYTMSLGADTHTPMNLENTEGLTVCNVTTDIYGRVHLLMSTESFEEWYIWCLDEDYQLEKEIDISEYVETKQIPIWFLIDKDGTYYFQWMLDRNGLLVDADGKLLHETTLESLGIGWIYEVAVRKDGEFYFLYRGEKDTPEFGVLDVEKGSIQKEDSQLLLPANETYSAMYAGTDTNLLLFSPISGIWAYDGEKGILENRVTISDIGFEKDMEFWPLNFLPDGRLLLLGQRIPDGSTETQDYLMKYIPAGK